MFGIHQLHNNKKIITKKKHLNGELSPKMLIISHSKNLCLKLCIKKMFLLKINLNNKLRRKIKKLEIMVGEIMIDLG
jgi:hypothetical protein